MQRTFSKAFATLERSSYVVLRSDVLILRIDCRGLEFGWSSQGRDSEFLDSAFERDPIVDDPRGDGTHLRGVLTD